MPRQPFVSSRLQGFGTTIFSQMSALAMETNAINLGQGFPDTDGPMGIRREAANAILNGPNQYPPVGGIADLRSAIVEHQKRFWGIELESDTQVVTTTGATEAIAAALIGLCELGDEVIVFDPTYDSYAAGIAMAGARPRPVVTHPADDNTFQFDEAELRAFGPRTELILLNTPHNPTGKVFSHDELALIADLCLHFNVLAVVDEVYEHLILQRRHHALRQLWDVRPNHHHLVDLTKCFSLTGWKVGWATGPSALIAAVQTAKQFLTFATGAPFQPAVASALQLDSAYFTGSGRRHAAPTRHCRSRPLRTQDSSVLAKQHLLHYGQDFAPRLQQRDQLLP
ncbi:MAG: aminotransferase class I/II-fold pyridoxal phosphate-dependent enzyme [Acidimicrobiales bacterium]